MDTLQIFENGGQWYAVIANTEVQYLFQGATTADQYKNVEVLAEGMRHSEEAAEAVLDHALELGQAEPANVFQELFGTTDKLEVSESLVWAATEEGASILDEIQKAGFAFTEFLEGIAAK